MNNIYLIKDIINSFISINISKIYFNTIINNNKKKKLIFINILNFFKLIFKLIF